MCEEGAVSLLPLTLLTVLFVAWRRLLNPENWLLMRLPQQKCFLALDETRISAIFSSAILHTHWSAFVVTLLHAFFSAFSKTLLHTMIRITVGDVHSSRCYTKSCT